MKYQKALEKANVDVINTFEQFHRLRLVCRKCSDVWTIPEDQLKNGALPKGFEICKNCVGIRKQKKTFKP